VKRAVLGAVFGAGLTVAPAFADSPSTAWNGLPDRFQVDTGYFRLTAETTLRYDGRAGSGDVSLEDDLGVPDTVDTFWIDGTWRVGRRHQLKLGYTRLNRDRAGFDIQRDFTWGGETYPAGLSADTSTGADILGGYYRFAIVRSERFEIGPTIGVGYLWLNARIAATGTVGGQSRSLDRKASTGSITGAVGGYASAWLTKRLVVRGDFLYIKVTPGDSDASVTDWRVGADYYFLRNVGLGAQYKYYQYSYDRGVLVSKLGGDITFKGFQAFLTFRF
jgi:opacity protein-like surface antigen